MYTSINNIIHEALADNEYSLHWYFPFLNHGIQALEQLRWDILGEVESKVLEVDKNGAANLPCDFLDLARIGWPGQRIRQLHGVDINRLVNRDSVGNAIPYPQRDFLRYNNWDYPLQWAEGGYSLIKERRQIQLTNQRAGFIYIDYLSDGTCKNSGTKINVFAKYAIKSYIEWKRRKPRTSPLSEIEYYKREFINEKEKLSSRLDPTTAQDVWSIFNRPHSTSYNHTTIRRYGF